MELIHDKAKELQSLSVNNEDYKRKVNEFYESYFLNGKNIFKQAGDNWEVRYDCGILSLKQSCFTEVFKTNVLINAKTGKA